MWSRWGIFFGIGAVVLAGLGVILLSRPPISVEVSLARGQQALEQGDFSTAIRHARHALRNAPESTTARLLAGRATVGMRDFRDSLEYLSAIPDDGSKDSFEARLLAGQVFLHRLCRPSNAEEEFRRAAKFAPDHPGVNESLAFIARLGCRHQEMVSFELRLIRAGIISPRRMAYLSLRERLPVDSEYIRKCEANGNRDPLCIMGRVRVLLMRGHDSDAISLLRRFVGRHPKSLAAQTQLGSILATRQDDLGFLAWHDSLPSEIDDNSDIWFIRGTWLEARSNPRAAVRCYLESLARDANDHRSNYRVGQLLVELGEGVAAQAFLKRAQSLQDYIQIVHAINARKRIESREADEPLAAARLAESLGLTWEAYGWFHLSAELEATNSEAIRGKSKYVDQIPTLGLTRSAADVNPAKSIDISRYPLPLWDRSSAPDRARNRDKRHRTKFSFEDHAATAGIHFSYDGNRVNEIRGLTRVYQSLGGGVAVLDYDLNGWPDLYFPQGCRLEPGDASPVPIKSIVSADAIYRNLGNGQFEDVAPDIGVIDVAYSHGAAIGDFDGDGFSDIYVCNLGGNRLIHNNGDGTFSDSTALSGTGGSAWSTSGMFADLDGDSLPDIYCVNYLSVEQALTTICRDEHGRQHGCLPSQFSATQDTLYLNQGDGTFGDATANSGIVSARGKGLGIVAGDFDDSGFLSVFVANDGEANFYYSRPPQGGVEPRLFSDFALFRGLAVNHVGLAEACMGVAIGDGDGDGRLDLFVTNFLEESNTFYRQGESALFNDVTAQAGLGVPSLNTLGFGTQFIDVDLDGSLDLAVANGHIDVSSNPNVPFKMAPQVFSNDGTGRFSGQPKNELGEYFQRTYLGRAMSRLDWNRDGREDLVITHLEAPAALLTNTTSGTGHVFALRLVGVNTNRDAVGTVVRLTTNGEQHYRQICAGDGYLASNQRLVTVGLEANDHVDRIEIRWPSGLTQEFSDPPVDVELLLVENQSRLLVIPSEIHQ